MTDFGPGDFVVHRLTGEICIVLDRVSKGYRVRCRDYSSKDFWPFELEKYDQDYQAGLSDHGVGIGYPVGWTPAE